MNKVILEKNDHMQAWGYIVPVLTEFARGLGLEILVSNPHKSWVSPKNEKGKLFLRFWSNASESIYGPVEYHLDSAYGIFLGNGIRDSVQPSRRGEVIRDPEGNAVAEVVGGTLYVLFDLPHGREGGDNEKVATLMRAIMNDYVHLRGLTLRSYEEDPWQDFLDFFRLPDGVLEMSEERIRERWDRLVNTVEANKGKLEVFPETIKVTLGPIKRRRGGNIGKYDFVIVPRHQSVRFYHLTPNTSRHGTVETNGSVCLGNAGGGMKDFIRRKDFEMAVALAIIFLEEG